MFYKVISGASVALASLGLGLASSSEAIRILGLQVPCRNAVCSAVARDPLNRFPPFTPGALAFLFFMCALVRSFRPTVLDRAWLVFSVVATALAFGLQAYVRSRYGDFCPWCLAIAGCVAGLAFCELITPLGARLGLRGILAVGLVGLALASGFIIKEKSAGIDRLRLSRLATTVISPESSRIGSAAIGPVFLVDFSCGVCHILMAHRLASGLPFAVRSAGKGDYDAAAAQYLASFPTPALRAIALRRILDEPSGVATAISHLPPPPGPSGRETVNEDRRFFASLRIVATPTVVEPVTRRVLDSE